MKKVLRYVLVVVFPFAGVSILFGSCASSHCNNDSCYSRKLSSVDPYKEGEVAAWGSEQSEKDADDTDQAKAAPRQRERR